MANPFPTISNTVGTLAAGHIVLATEWNAAVGGLYTYINNTLLNSGLNKLSAKGDIYVFDGASLQALSTGGAPNDGKVIVTDSTTATGLKFGSIVNTTVLTTKGDTLVYSTGLTRVPIGADATVWTADSTNPNGAAWKTAPGVPVGGIILWSQAFGTIPAGYNLCDGGTYNGITTPNMQGVYLVGAGNGVNPPATSGMGNLAVNTPGGDVSAGQGLGPTHAHAASTGISQPGTTAYAAGGTATALYPGTVTASTVVGGATITPRYNTLFFIMRTI